jgi:hypothetical protein
MSPCPLFFSISSFLLLPLVSLLASQALARMPWSQGGATDAMDPSDDSIVLEMATQVRNTN